MRAQRETMKGLGAPGYLWSDPMKVSATKRGEYLLEEEVFSRI